MLELPILFLDEHLLAVDKPAGLPTLPDGYDQSAPCLINLLKQQYDRVWVVHRLDKEERRDRYGALGRHPSRLEYGV